jgi:RHS repeat-associated protein
MILSASDNMTVTGKRASYECTIMEDSFSMGTWDEGCPYYSREALYNALMSTGDYFIDIPKCEPPLEPLPLPLPPYLGETLDEEVPSNYEPIEENITSEYSVSYNAFLGHTKSVVYGEPHSSTGYCYGLVSSYTWKADVHQGIIKLQDFERIYRKVCDDGYYLKDNVCTKTPDCSKDIKGSTWNAQTKQCECPNESLDINGTCELELKDGEEGKCKAHVGSYVIPKTREFHEDINIAGSDITLHYASSRVSGYKNALYPYIILDIAEGWTLSNIHHYSNQTLYLGNGENIEYKDYEITTLKSGNTIVYDKSHMGYEFNPSGNIIRVFDPKSSSNIYTYTYDKKTNILVSITDIFGRVTKLNRDNTGKVSFITAPFGQITYLNTSADNNLIFVSYEDGSTYYFTYNNRHLLTSKTDPKNYTYRYEYNTNGRISKTSNPLNREYFFGSYIQDNTHFSSFTTPSGDTYSYSNAKTDSNGVQSSTSKKPSGLGIAVNSLNDKRDIEKNYCGIKEKKSYDIDALSMQNRLSSITTIMPSGLTNTQNFYIDYKKLTSKTYKDTSTITSNGKTSTITTDYLLGIQTIVSPEERKTTVIFDTDTYLPKSIIKTGELDTHYTYNSKNQLTRIYRGLKDVRYTYDSKNNIASITDSLGNTYQYSYDLKDRVTSIKNPNNQYAYFIYDQNDNMIKLTNPNSNDNSFDYNALDLKTVWDTPLGLRTQYEYDADKRVSKITKASGKDISYEYKDSKLKSIITPEERYNYEYDCLGQVSLIYLGEHKGDDSSDNSGSDNESSRYVFMAPTNSSGTNHGIGIVFDPIDNAAQTSTDPDIFTRYTYDGNLLTKISQTGTLNQDISFTYNNDFIPNSITYANEKESFTYDKDNLLIQTNDVKLSRDKYMGAVNKITDNSFERTMGYSVYNEKDKTEDKINKNSIYKEDITSISDNSQILKISESLYDRDIKYTFSYDKQGRLTKSVQEHKNIKNQKSYDYTEEFSYDNQGNILKHTIINDKIKTTKTGIYDIDDRTQIFDDTNYVYDSDGQLILKQNSKESTSYSYDTFGNLKEVILSNNDKITYLYNANNQRTVKLINNEIVEKYLWLNLTTLLAIYDKDNNLISRFYYADDRVPYKVKHNNQIYYLSYNHQGSLKAITDTTGQTIKSVIHSVYGNIINDTDPNLNIPIGFAGGLYDKDTKLTKFGYRDYDSNTGKWITKDPIDFDGGSLNLYGYVLNDPVNLVDAEGLDSFEWERQWWHDFFTTAFIFMDNQDKLMANLDIHDKYFHCMANCQAADLGTNGKKVADYLNILKEWYDQDFGGYSRESCLKDLEADYQGLKGRGGDCVQRCLRYPSPHNGL